MVRVRHRFFHPVITQGPGRFVSVLADAPHAPDGLDGDG